MKISLNLDELSNGDDKGAQSKALERLIGAAKAGDYEARQFLCQHYLPFLTSLAKKRSSEVAEINEYIERGKRGLLTAAKKYKGGSGDRFKLFALDYIEKSMDSKGGSGLFSKLFGSG